MLDINRSTQQIILDMTEEVSADTQAARRFHSVGRINNHDKHE